MPRPNGKRTGDGEEKTPTMAADPTSPCCGLGQCGPAGASRREFIKLAGASAASLAAAAPGWRSALAQPTDADGQSDHFVPADKKLDPKWLDMLSAQGESTVYSGDDLDTIAMPVGGVCTGQVYLAGDGRLTHWDVFNQRIFTGYGRDNYRLGRGSESPLEQGFAIQVESGGKRIVRSLDRAGFPGVQFCGEYPIGRVEYEDKDVPVSVKLEAFSPFIPLDADDSGLPAVMMHFTVKNLSQQAADVTLAGWLENGVCLESAAELPGVRTNRMESRDGAVMILSGAKQPEEAPPAERPPIVLADFEGKDYGQWKVEGEAFGKGPAQGTLERQQPVSGFQGKGLVNTYLGAGDQLTGKLTSPKFKIERRFLSFLIGGGDYADQTCINLLVDGKVVHTAVGKRDEKLLPCNWNVAALEGKEAQLEIVDQATGPWGHVNIDQIEMRDTPMSGRDGSLDGQPDFGTMALAVLEGPGETFVSALCPENPMPDVFPADPRPQANAMAEKPFGERLCGALGRKLSLEPGGEAAVTFAVTWHFPNRPERGNYYCNRFDSAADVAGYLAANLDRLAGETRLWHATWYDATLPHWLLDRLFSTVSTLATSTCQRWENGRFWAWEGVGCCQGTCTHVWNYEHAMARLFPELERSCREVQDYGTGFVEETGMVRFRGENWNNWAGDGQAGTVLKAYREHQMSADAGFLERNWTKIRKSLEFLINEDKDAEKPADGILEGSQHNTYDINFFGANTMVGSLYLAALRAGDEMAREMDDLRFAQTCRRLFESGSKASVERLFNGEYFIQDVDLAQHDKHQYGQGCLADQLFGQGWAHQVGLGYVYPEETVLATLAAIWKYNWAPDVGPQNAVHGPERWFARPGEAGLFTCTWPQTPHLSEGVRYKNEVWTGIEYQVAGNMAWDGMVTEALAICRGIHERYHPSKHNPFNEIECGDHYARGMASHGVFLGLCGLEYHGPKAHLGFAPRITPEDFRAAFTAAEGWGTLCQTRRDGEQVNRIEVKWGEVRIKTFAFELPEEAQLKSAEVRFMGNPIRSTAKQDGRRVIVTLTIPSVVEHDQKIEVKMAY